MIQRSKIKDSPQYGNMLGAIPLFFFFYGVSQRRATGTTYGGKSTGFIHTTNTGGNHGK